MSACTCPPNEPPFVVMLSIDCPIHGEEARRRLRQAIDEGKVIAPQPPGRCALCGAVEETRPYGPNGEEVCFKCGMKDEAAAKRGFEKRFGE